MIEIYECTTYISPAVLSDYLQLKKYTMIYKQRISSIYHLQIGKAPYLLEVVFFWNTLSESITSVKRHPGAGLRSLIHSSKALDSTKAQLIDVCLSSKLRRFHYIVCSERKQCNLGHFSVNADFFLSFIRIPNLTHLGNHLASLLSSYTWSFLFCFSPRNHRHTNPFNILTTT